MNTFFIAIFFFLCAVSCKHQKMQDGDNIYLIPTEEKHTETLIYIHGLAQSAEIMYQLFFEGEYKSLVRTSTKVVLLNAPEVPLTALRGRLRNSWFDIISFRFYSESELEKTLNLNDIVANGEKIKKVIAQEIQELNGESTKVFIGGFSQGCFMSLYCGLTYHQPLGGIMGSAGALIPRIEINEANSKIPLFITHGTADNLVNYQLADKIYKEKLDPNHHEIVKVYEIGVGHIITPTMQEKAREWFFAQTELNNEDLLSV